MGNLAQNIPAEPLTKTPTNSFGSPLRLIHRGTYALILAQTADNAIVRERLREQDRRNGMAPPHFKWSKPDQVFHTIAMPEPQREDEIEIACWDGDEWHARRVARLVEEHFAVITPLRREAERLRGDAQRAYEFLRLAEGVLVAAEERLTALRTAEHRSGSLLAYSQFDAAAELGRLVGYLFESEAL